MILEDFHVTDGTGEPLCVEAEELPRRTTRRPQEPTAQERMDHEELHEPYRDWCQVCVEGRGRAEYASRADRTEDAVPVFAWDNGFMKKSDSSTVVPDVTEVHSADDDDTISSPILCGRLTSDRWLEGAVLPCKGTDHSYCHDRLLTQDWACQRLSSI